MSAGAASPLNLAGSLDGLVETLKAARASAPPAERSKVGWRRVDAEGVMSVRVEGCYDCRDTGTTTEDRNGYAFAVRCGNCGAKRAAAARFNRARLPVRLVEAQLDNFKPHTAGMAAALEAAKRLASADSLEGGSMLLMGERGSGKTHLLVGLARQLVARWSVRFVEEPDLLDAIKATFDGHGSRDRILDPLVRADVLVIDEFGRSNPTDWSTSTIGDLVNHRWRCGRPTMVATNWGAAALEKRLGGHIMRRLLDGNPPLAFGARKVEE